MEIREEIRRYVLENFVPAGQGDSLEDTTPLISGGLIDSIGMIGLISFIEGRFDVEFTPREVDTHRMDTIELIELLVRKKLAAVR